jgi:oligogalacturonide lyase
MGKGDRFPAEGRRFQDARTGAPVRQLTDYKGHSHHLYFTNSGWYDRGVRLLFASDRGNRSNLFSVEIASGEITQLTDLDRPSSPEGSSLLFTSLNPLRPEAYFWHERRLVALDLNSLRERVLFRAPDGFLTNMTSVTADGRYLCTGLYQDLSDRFPVDLLNGFVGFEQYFEARPLSRIVRVDVDSGAVATVFEERSWIGHCNASPGLPSVITFCHEGPWDRVDHRIWGLDIRAGRAWKIRPALAGEEIGHEYWLADGEHVAYHGRTPDQKPFFGRTRFDNEGTVEGAFSSDSNHFHGNSLELVVGDGTRNCPRLLLWSLREREFEGPRVLLTHRGSFQTQTLHVHPRLSPDGRQVLFVSDMSGYGNLYLAELPPFASLPLLNRRQ